MQYIFNNYSKVYLLLNYPYSTGPVIADLDQLKADYYNNTSTLTQVIATIPNGYFTALPSLPNNVVYRARYIDAGLAGFVFSQINEKDILLQYPSDIDPNDFISYCLASVDDYIMPVSLINNQLIIENGFLNCQINNDTRVGILSFEDVGAISITPITPQMLVLAPNSSPLDFIYINANLPNPNYITLLVLNGYLVLPDKTTFYPIGNGNFALSLNNFNIVYKLLDSETRQFFNSSFISNYFQNFVPTIQMAESNPNNTINITEKDYSEFNGLIPGNMFFSTSNLSASNQNSYSLTINTSLLNTPQFVSAYMTLPNTFLVQIPTNNFVKIDQNILNTEIANTIVSDIQPTSLLVNSSSRLIDYFYSFKKGKYIITSPQMQAGNYITKFLNTNWNSFITNQRVPNDPLVRSALWWRELNFY